MIPHMRGRMVSAQFAGHKQVKEVLHNRFHELNHSINFGQFEMSCMLRLRPRLLCFHQRKLKSVVH